MFKEMYEGLVEILKQAPEDEIMHLKKVGRIPHFLNLVYNFNPTDIKRVNTIKIDGLPEIKLVLTNFPEESKNSKYADYIIHEGKLTKIILINMNDLLDEDPMVQMISIGWVIWQLVFTATETYIDIFDKTKNTHAAATNVLYYAPAVLMIRVLDKLYGKGKISDNTLSLVINNFYHKNKILPIGVTSIRTAIDEVTIEVLLDYNIWDAMIVSALAYPGAAFGDVDAQETLKYCDDLKDTIRSENEEDTTDPV